MPDHPLHEPKAPLLHVRLRDCPSLAHDPLGVLDAYIVRMFDSEPPCAAVPQPTLHPVYV